MYKFADKLKQEIQQAATNMEVSRLPEAVQIIIDTTYEYEHGTADVEDVFPEALVTQLDRIMESDERWEYLMEAYANIAHDICLTILAQS